MSIHWGGRGAGHVSRWSASTTGVPALVLDFLTTTSLDSRVTFTRGSNATLVDSTGKITYAPANFFTFSEQFDNAAWSKTNTTVTANSTTAPNGTLTADTLTATAGTAISVRMGQSGTTITATTYVTSFYVRPGTHTFVQIHINAQSADWVNFTLTGSGTVQNNGAAVGAISFDSATGYYRISATYTAGSTDRTPFFGIVPSGTATRNQTWNPTGTETVFVWGAQFEPVTYQTAPGVYNATTSAAYYGPRFDYDPVTLASKGLLIEEQRINVFTYSEQFDNAGWTKLNATVTANATTSPDGTTNADKLIGAAGLSNVTVFQSPALTASTQYTETAYAKKSEWSWLALEIRGEAIDAVQAWFNLNTGVVGTIVGAGTATITDAGNGWYRCSLTRTMGATTTSPRVRIYPTNANASTSTGDGTSGVFVWGAQLEAGAFATSYIPTVAAAVTRSPDIATMTGTNFSSWYNATQGTFVSQFTPTTISGTRAVLDANDNTANESIRLQTVSADPFFTVTDDGVDQASIDAGTVAANTNYKIAAAYAVNDFAVSLGGATVGTDTSGTLPTVTQMQIGNSAAGNRLNGHVRSIAYYKTRLYNSQLQTLTQ